MLPKLGVDHQQLELHGSGSQTARQHHPSQPKGPRRGYRGRPAPSGAVSEVDSFLDIGGLATSRQYKPAAPVEQWCGAPLIASIFLGFY